MTHNSFLAGRFRDAALTLSLCLLSACSQTVHAPEVATKNADNAKISKNLVGSPKSDEYTQSSHVDSAPRSNFDVDSPDMKAESEVDDKLLIAWRLAVKGEEKQSLAMMDSLDKKYPKFRTVAAMRGQILEHFGHIKEAMKYYEVAANGNDFDLLHTYKLARGYRTAGDTKAALEKYRKLVESAPEFPPGRYGLAQVLLAQDKNSAEAKKLLDSLNPAEKESLAAADVAETKKASERNGDLKGH